MRKDIKFTPDFQEETEHFLINIKEYSSRNILKCSELIKILQKMNPDAVCLTEYDGIISPILMPEGIKLREIWGETEYVSASFIPKKNGFDQVAGDDAIIF